MPNNNNSEVGKEEADFSSYLNDETVETPQNKQSPQSPLQELPATPKFTKRVMYLIIFFVILAVAQVVMLVLWNKDKTPETPAGYRLVSPPNQPAYIEPIK